MKVARSAVSITFVALSLAGCDASGPFDADPPRSPNVGREVVGSSFHGGLPSTIVALDFEDGRLPSEHGWQTIPRDNGVHTIVPAAGPDGSAALQIEGPDRFGWWFDLSGLVGLDEDWSFTIDVQCVGGCAPSKNDIVVARYGVGNGGLHHIGTGTFDRAWHTLRLEMEHALDEIRVYTDGTLVDTRSPFDGGSFLPSDEAIVFHFGNHSVYRTARFDNVRFESWGTTIEVDVDVKPGSETNPVNTRSRGVLPVAVLTTPHFDAAFVDPLSVAFGPAGATEAHRRGLLDDVDDDGDADLVLHFRVRDTGIARGDTEACLVGETLDGTAIEGCDAVRVLR